MNSSRYNKIQKRGKGFLESLMEKSAVWWIIVTCILVYALFLINPNLANYFAISANNIFAGKYLWTLITHIFAHASFSHLFFNMFTLYFIGTFTEKLIGRKRFFWFFLISGIFAGFISVLLARFLGFGFLERIFSSSDTLMVGASGAIFGLLGILAVLIPKKRVSLILGPLIVIVLSSFINNLLINLVLTVLLILMMIAIIPSFFSLYRLPKWTIPVDLPLWLAPIVAIVPLIVIGLFVSLPIGNMAHLFGLVAGLIYGFYLRNKYRKKVEILQRMVR